MICCVKSAVDHKFGWFVRCCVVFLRFNWTLFTNPFEIQCWNVIKLIEALGHIIASASPANGIGTTTQSEQWFCDVVTKSLSRGLLLPRKIQHFQLSASITRNSELKWNRRRTYLCLSFAATLVVYSFLNRSHMKYYCSIHWLLSVLKPFDGYFTSAHLWWTDKCESKFFICLMFGIKRASTFRITLFPFDMLLWCECVKKLKT